MRNDAVAERVACEACERMRMPTTERTGTTAADRATGCSLEQALTHVNTDAGIE